MERSTHFEVRSTSISIKAIEKPWRTVSQNRWEWHPRLAPLVNVYSLRTGKLWDITIFNGKTMGKPWENHEKMVIYMERSTIFLGKSAISTGPWLQ